MASKRSPKREEEEWEIDDALAKSFLLPDDTGTELILRSHGIYYISGEIDKGDLRGIHQDILLKHYLGASYFKGDIKTFTRLIHEKSIILCF